MLHQKIVDAVRAKQFSIYAVNHAEEALELLTGCKPGSLNSKGEYTRGSLNFKVVNRLKEISELSKEGN